MRLFALFRRKKSPLADGTITGDALAAVQTAFDHHNENHPYGIQYSMFVNYAGEPTAEGYFKMIEQGKTINTVPFSVWAFREAMYLKVSDDPRGDHLVFPRFGDTGTIEMLVRHTRPRGFIPDIAA